MLCVRVGLCVCVCVLCVSLHTRYTRVLTRSVSLRFLDMFHKSYRLLSREAQKFRNIGTARYEARELSRRMHIAQMAIQRDEWEKAKVFKDPSEQLWLPFIVLACVPLGVLFASVPHEIARIVDFVKSSETTGAVLLEDLNADIAIQEYRDSLPTNEADAFTKPELWGQN